jgi:sec-independent protein translocase protein TatC
MTSPAPETLPETGNQPLIAHLIELRNRLLCVFLVFGVAAGACYFFAADIYGFLTEPLAHLPHASQRRLIYTGLTEAFTTYLKVALFAGGLITVPFMLLQIWLFMAPGLYSRERGAILPFFIAAPILFALGACLAFYGVIPIAWEFFLSFETPQPANGLPIVLEARVAEYLSLTMTLIFAFGIAFQLPILLGVLGRLGVVKAGQLARFRKWAVVLILIVAAILTPPDVLSQSALAIPLYCLYEMSIWLVRWQGGEKNAGSGKNS